jgi:hypothetical protein
MKINLRKSVALQQEIQAVLRNISLSSLGMVKLNEHESVSLQMDTALDSFYEGVNKKKQLTECLYLIRADVAVANAFYGVGELLTRIAYIDAQTKDSQDSLSAGLKMSDSLITGTLNKLKTTETSGVYSSRSGVVNTSVLTQEYIDAIKLDLTILKRQKQSLKDKLLELNIKTEIEISEETLILLQLNGIL